MLFDFSMGVLMSALFPSKLKEGGYYGKFIDSYGCFYMF